jgi:sugar phosphate isomerase/epimerase
MKLAVCVQTDEVPVPVPVALLAGSFAERVQKATAMGFEGLELMTTDPASLDPKAIRAQVEEARLEIAAIGSGAIAFATGLTLLHADPDRAAQAQALLRDLIGFAAAVGAPLVTIGSFRGRVASAGAGGRERLVAILQEAAAYAESRVIQLALEPMNHYDTDVIINAEEGLAFVEEVSQPALGILLDTHHINIEESSWTEPFRRVMAAGRLWHVHLRDNNRLHPGGGLIDFGAIVTTLREIGYTGYVSAELLAKPDPDTAAQRTLTYMRPLLKV